MPAAHYLHRIGARAALAVFFARLLYIATGVVWLLSERDPALRQSLTPSDPYLAILEALIVLTCPLMVVTMASVHTNAAREKATCSLAALSFMILLTGVTCSIHFAQLAVIRRIDPLFLNALRPIVSLPWHWPSVVFALDLLAWDLFFGLSMLFAAPVFRGGALETIVRRTMYLSGVLSIAGLLGPALGDLRFQQIAIVGYAGLGTVAFGLLSGLLFRAPMTPVETKWKAKSATA
jgi:hypothetical protein